MNIGFVADSVRSQALASQRGQGATVIALGSRDPGKEALVEIMR